MLARLTIRRFRVVALIAFSGACGAASYRTRAQVAAPAPNVNLSVNGTPEPVVLQGEALVFTSVLFHPNIFATGVAPLLINPKSGSWGNTVQIFVTDGSGANVNWPLHVVVSPPGSLTLDAQQTGILQWVVQAADAAKIAPGTYQIQAVLDTTGSAGSTGWKGTAVSDGALVQIIGIANPTPDQIEQQMESLVLSEHLLGNDTQALIDLDKLVTQFPTSLEARELQAKILDSVGQPKAALKAYEAAINTFYAQQPSTPQEPPSQYLRPAAELRKQVYGNSGSGSPAATSVVIADTNTVYSAALNAVSLKATVSSTSGTVSGGTVTVTVTALGSPVTSVPVVQGIASASLSIPAGAKVGTYPVQVSYSGTNNFFASSDTTHTLIIGKATPAITWHNPAPIQAGTALGTTQLNATSTVPGKFVYTPPAGTVLNGNSSQSLGVFFAPTDSVDYNSATATVSISVAVAKPGDLNGDGINSCADLAIVKASFGKKAGQAGFDLRADVNGDGIVNVLDLSFVARQLPAGTVCN